MGVRLVIRSAEGQPLSEEVSYDFEQARIVIGRGPGADVRIPHLTVSELHATLRLQDDVYGLLDNDSTNGTFVNGTRLSAGRSKRLHDGDLIDVGAYVIAFRSGIALSQPTTMERTAELARRLFRRSQAGARVDVARLVVLSGPCTGKSLDIPAPVSRSLVGRGESCQLVLPDPEIAPEHAELVHDLDGVLMRHVESKHALTINGQVVAQRRLRDGDELLLGTTRLLFEEPAEEPIDALGTEADRPVIKATATAVAAPAVTVADAAPAAESAAPHEPPLKARDTRNARSSFDADVIIYALAAIVIAISVAGLFVLMRGD
jgi:pSer/pThr/pTyr-binding forkhead associated (FHA) protein